MAVPSSYYQFAWNGWLFGGPGQGVQVLSVEGLENLPDLRTQDTTRGYLDGMLTGRDFLNGRSITFHLQIMSDASNSMFTYLQQLKLNLLSQQSGTGTLNIYLPGRSVQTLYGRVRHRTIAINPEYTYGRAEALVEIFCPDPRIYGSVSSLVLSSSGANVRQYPRTYPMTYSVANIGTNIGNLTNNGTYETGITITISGTCTSPVVRNVTTGQFLSFSGLSLAASDSLVINTQYRTILLNGTPARNNLTNDSSWFMLSPGSASFFVSTTSGTASATLQSYDAYI